MAWCEYDRTLPMLPAFVREGLTAAIAQPYDGSSYGGAEGESCGECWEVSTVTDTRTVMIHDLCPIEGNPLCAGGHFHLDLSQESAAALHGGGLDEASARRVPCPVNGNIHAQINDRNEWGYLRVAFINHRIPIRSAEYRAANGTTWAPVERSGGAWHIINGDDAPFRSGGPGGLFRLTSVQGQTVEMPSVLPYSAAKGSVLDLGGQFPEQASTGGVCAFSPPADIYVDGYGGIDQVRWSPNPWSGTASEVTEGCFAGSCIRVDGLSEGGGFHLVYPQQFPTMKFSSVSLRVRALAGSGEVAIAPAADPSRCRATTINVSSEWTLVTIDLRSDCAGVDRLNDVTVTNFSSATVLLVDDARFAP